MERKVGCVERTGGEYGDAFTQKKITERVEAGEKKRCLFDVNPDNTFVYVVKDKERDDCGYFSSSEMAVEYAIQYAEKYKEYRERCSINKQRIVRSEADLRVRYISKCNPVFFPEEKKEEIVDYSGESIVTLYLDAKGQIIYLYSSELSDEEDALIDEFRKDRFESQYIRIPYEMQAGWQVKYVVDGSYYVLDTNKKIWDEDGKRWEKNPSYYDFSDVQAVVFRPTESGVWSHEHINPMYLAVEAVPDADSNEKKEAYKKAMEAMSHYFTAEKSNANGEVCYLDDLEEREIVIEDLMGREDSGEK